MSNLNFFLTLYPSYMKENVNLLHLGAEHFMSILLFDIFLSSDTTINIELLTGVVFDSMVVVTDERGNANVENTKIGTIELDIKEIKKLPSLMGEVDILKTIQLIFF